jgi:hypothetical protein
MPGARESNRTLADVANSFTKLNSSYNYFHGKIYSFIPPEPQKFAEFSAAFRVQSKMFPNSHPATMVVGKLASLVPAQISQVMAVEDEQLRVLMQVAELKIPDCNYLAIISPVENGASGTDYQRAIESINFLRTITALPFGKLPFYGWIADFDFNAAGVLSVPGDIIRMPMYGDFFKILDFGLVNEITGRLALQQADYRTRLRRATGFFDKALSENDEAFKFSSYWIALEIVVGGKSDAIRSKLAAAYEQRNKKFADDKLMFKEIEGMRHDLIHKGIFSLLTSYQERLMQLLFWDIVIHQIGLRPRGLAKTFVESGLVEQENSRAT